MNLAERGLLWDELSESVAEIAAALKARGVEIPEELKARDRREPGRLEKEKMEGTLFRLFRKRFGSQARGVKEYLEALRGAKSALTLPPGPSKTTARVQASPTPIGAGEGKTIAGIPDDPEWDEEEFFGALIRILLRGATAGIGLATGIGFDPTLTNTRAAEWARSYGYELVRKIDQVTVEALQSAISDFIQTPGMTIGDVMERLPFGEERALRVAVTETTRAYAEGQKLAGEQLKQEHPGVAVIKTWYTNNDDLVCDICGPLDGAEALLDENFESAGESIDAPPAHVNCRCWMSTTTRLVRT